MSVLEIQNLTKNYGKNRGVSEVNLKIDKGEVLGFIGPNGAGKSTTIKCVMNQINKNFGKIIFNDKELLVNDINSYAEIGYLPSEIYLYNNMTGGELIKFNASFYKTETLKRAYELVEKLNFDVKKKFSELSLGNSKKLGIILAFMHSPKLIIMDEATSGLDPLAQDCVYQLIREEQKKGTSFLFSSHNLREVKNLCDKVVFIKDGKILQFTSIKDVVGHNAVKVRFESEQLIDEKLNYTKEGTSYSKMFEGNMNDLIKELSNFKVTRLTIEEPELEEVFKFYY